jgi:hypothetical protein
VRRRSSAGPPQRWGRCWILAAALPWVACAPAGPPSEEASPATAVVPATEEYTKQIEGWREERRANLLSEDGWFSLVGLYWLEPGASTFGSGEDADLGFPAGTPERIGTFHLEDGEVTLEPAAGSGLRIADGEPVAGTIPLAADTSGDPTVLQLGTLSFYVIERGGKYGIRAKDSASPALQAFEGLEYFPLDPAWRIEAQLEPEEGATVTVPNVLGQVEDVRAPGTLTFRAPGGEELHLTPMQEAPGEDLFIVFGDPTNGHGTYGGGRFLYADPPGEDGRVVLDFNRAYNPPCAFTPFATCPLPPDVNKLDVAVRAGEKSYAGEVAGHQAG